ncbi:hypothetical membrane protein [Mycobacterium tuberculosis GM 1503]|nr:hypothetical membrane protein [Mycobacterium tuberculosis GM 1503]
MPSLPTRPGAGRAAHTRLVQPGIGPRRRRSAPRRRQRDGDPIPPVATRDATSSPGSRPTSFARATPKPLTHLVSSSWISQVPLVFRRQRCRGGCVLGPPSTGGGALGGRGWAFLGLVGAGVVGTLFLNRDRESIDDKYLAALRRSGLTGEFNSDANAIARGKQVCRQLQDGGEQQGMPVDQVAVQYYCPQFSDGFHILETITVTGSFTLKDESPNVYAPAITVSGSGCSGSAGYADIDRGTQVTVKNGQGDILATAFLQAGQGGRFLCTFPFSFEITEGEDRYVVSVSRRGEMSYSFADLKANGLSLVLG